MTTWRDRVDTILGGMIAGAGIALGVALSLWLIAAIVVGSVALGRWLEAL